MTEKEFFNLINKYFSALSKVEKIEDLLLSIKDKTLIVVSHQFTQEKIPAFDTVVDFTKN